MANEQNLVPEAHKLTNEDRSKGGKARVVKLNQERIIKDEILKAMGAKDWEEVIDGVIKRAKESDKGFEVLQASIGQKPVDKSAVEVQSKGIEDILREYGSNKRRY